MSARPPKLSGAAPLVNTTTVARVSESPTSEISGARDSGLAKAELARRLGLDPNTGASAVLEVLGPKRLSEETAVHVPGVVLWCDPARLRQLGFTVAPGNGPDEGLERELIERLAIRIPEPGEHVGSGKTSQVYADKYGGTGTGGRPGSGRSVFLPELNLSIKGVGLTKLAKRDPDDFKHSHGRLSGADAVQEAVWSQVADNLFSEGSSSVVAIIDIGRHVKWPDASEEYSVLLVRAGDQIRPGHLLETFDGGFQGNSDVLIRALRQQGLLVEHESTRGGEGRVDLHASILRMVDQHAKTAAEMASFRILHGALSTGNMELHGGQLDLTTMTAQSRTASIKTSQFPSRFREEHHRRLEEINRMLRAVWDEMSPADRKRTNFQTPNVGLLFTAAYDKHYQRSLLERSGLKSELASDLIEKRPKLCRELAALIDKMSGLENRSSVLVEKELPEDVGVLDVFGLLRRAARLHFEDALDRASVRECLSPKVTVAGKKKAKMEATVDRLIESFVGLFPKVMKEAESLASEHYDDVFGFRYGVSSRAEIENEPMPEMYKAKLYHDAINAIDDYRASGNRSVFTELIDKRAASSFRSFDRLFEQGETRVLKQGGLEIERRTIDGITYSVQAWPGGQRRVRLALPLTGQDPLQLASLSQAPSFSRDQIVSPDGGPSPLRFRYSTKGWTDGWREVGAKIERDEQGHEQLVFDIQMERGEGGRLEGALHSTTQGSHWFHERGSDFRGYTFAVPDDRDLSQLHARFDLS